MGRTTMYAIGSGAPESELMDDLAEHAPQRAANAGLSPEEIARLVDALGDFVIVTLSRGAAECAADEIAGLALPVRA